MGACAGGWGCAEVCGEDDFCAEFCTGCFLGRDLGAGGLGMWEAAGLWKICSMVR
jgi:hypothetical protein